MVVFLKTSKNRENIKNLTRKKSLILTSLFILENSWKRDSCKSCQFNDKKYEFLFFCSWKICEFVMISIHFKMSIWRYLFREVKTVKLEKIAKTHFYAFWLWKTLIWQEKIANSISFSWKREPCQFDEIKKSKKASKKSSIFSRYIVSSAFTRLRIRFCASFSFPLA